MNPLVATLIILGVTLGPSIVIAVIGYAGMQALGRNPSAAPRIQTSMILGFLFVEVIAVIALLILFHVFSKT
ncbi:MAG: ATP synthase F0 subunit C [Candidatus Omnitrophica bacterium]|nr:ATP synthase F0 subunit C [Candidatus Omnitrophota bacterium]